MTSTSQDPNAKEAVDSSSTTQAPEAKKEARDVPLKALTAAREKARESNENAEALRKRAEEAEAELARLKAGQAPAAEAQPPNDTEDIRKALREIQAKEQKRDLIHELGLADERQAEVVAEIMAKNPGLERAEALDLAAKRKPDLFQERGQPGFDPRIHGSMRPRPGSAPEPKESDRDKRLKAIASATGTDKSKLLNNMVGSLAAKAMGPEWSKYHKKIPL